MKVQVLVDNSDSWYVPYGQKLVSELVSEKINAVLRFKHIDVVKGDILCLIGCKRKFKNLHLNKYNLVVHESDLPKGKGWSPLTWQILEDKNKIPITLFEATDEIDVGQIYLKDYLEFDGTELLAEIKHKQGKKTNEMILSFIKEYPNNERSVQHGKSSYYKRRTSKDSELDVDKSIRDC